MRKSPPRTEFNLVIPISAEKEKKMFVVSLSTHEIIFAPTIEKKDIYDYCTVMTACLFGPSARDVCGAVITLLTRERENVPRKKCLCHFPLKRKNVPK